jgi:transglutaminase-like putative cysteine protease
MYDIKQFRPALYLVVMIGISGFCMAAEAPGLWVFATVLMLTNVWLIHQKQFKPLPRFIANIITLCFFAYAFVEVRSRDGSPILAVGQFLVFLQLVKIWEQRANRDYAQLLVLSLLLMVSAAISTASLIFGLLFIAYLFLSLYCCLLFHLKVEADEAKAAMAPALAHWGEGPLRQDQTHLAGSMRRLTGLVAAYALISAVVVFLLFPRNTGAGIFGQFQWKPKNTMTGFSEQVSFQNVAKIAQNDDVVGTVKVWQDGQILPSRDSLLLRGLTHDYYNGSDDSEQAKYQWTHPSSMEDMSQDENSNSGEWVPSNTVVDPYRLHPAPSAKPRYRQEIELNPTGTTVMFAMAGAWSVKPLDMGNLRNFRLRYSEWDQTIRADNSITQPIRYEVESTGSLGNELPPSRIKSHIDPLISEFARKPEVTGGLAAQREAEMRARPDHGLFYTSPLDGRIAQNIERYLKQNYKYTLDLTDVTTIENRDPMVAFLYDFKKGHCEYFAGAMTLLCQSLGMNARLVIGFKCDDYNEYGHFYTIRQSQAHAWVEVKTTTGWKSFDPTSGDVITAKTASMWTRSKRLFDFLEYTWQNSVISYSAETRDSLMNAAENRLTQTAAQSSQGLTGWRKQFDSLSDAMATQIVGPVVGLLATAIIVAVVWFAIERWKLRRRARRIGIVNFPPSTQARLMRQLGFYDDLLQLLEKHHIHRPPHLTPLEFCDSLAFLPSSAYDTIYRITQLFYRIRYGEAELDAGQLRRVATAIDRLSRQMPVGGNSE